MALAYVLQSGCRHTTSDILCLSGKPALDRGGNPGLVVVPMQLGYVPIQQVNSTCSSLGLELNHFHIFYLKPSFHADFIFIVAISLFFHSISSFLFLCLQRSSLRPGGLTVKLRYALGFQSAGCVPVFRKLSGTTCLTCVLSCHPSLVHFTH